MKTKHSKGYWTPRRILKAALKCKTPSEFWKKFRGAASKAINLKIYDLCIEHMPKLNRKKRGFYNDSKNIKDAYSQALSRSDLNKRFQGAVSAAKKIGIHNQLIAKIPIRVRKPIAGEESNIRKIAKNYNEVAFFAEMEPGAYSAASKMRILSEVTAHMTRKGNIYHRFVYQAFNYPFAYIGLTCNIEKRFNFHRSCKDKVREDLFKSKSTTFIISERMKAQDASNLEKQLIIEFRKLEDWIILNRHEGGGLGSPARIETVNDIIKKVKGLTPKEIKLYHSGTYKTICNLSEEEKVKIKAVLKYNIKPKHTDNDVATYCSGKTLKYVRKHYPGIAKRLINHPDKARIKATMIGGQKKKEKKK